MELIISKEVARTDMQQLLCDSPRLEDVSSFHFFEVARANAQVLSDPPHFWGSVCPHFALIKEWYGSKRNNSL